MRTGIAQGVLILGLIMPGICSAQKAPKPANFSITATDTKEAPGDVYQVAGTFSTAGPLQPGVQITSWNISVGPHTFSNLESPFSSAFVFRAVSSYTRITADTYPNIGAFACQISPPNIRIQFLNYLTGYFFTIYVPTGKLVAPGRQASLSTVSNCLSIGGIEFTALRRSGLAKLRALPGGPDPGWDHSSELGGVEFLDYGGAGSYTGGGDSLPGNYAEGTVSQF